MRNKSGIYKIVAICASAIVALAMLVPTVTSAVGLSAANNSGHNAASDSSSATSTRSSSSSSSASTPSTRSADDADDKEWIKLPGRNLKWLIIAGTWDTIHLKPIDPNKPVYGGNTGYGTGSGKFDSIFGTLDGNYSGPGFDALKNQIKTIIIDEDMTLYCAKSMFQGYTGLQKVVGLKHIKFADDIKDNSLQSMFAECTNLETLDGIQNWDMSNITNTSFMFANDKKLKNIDLSGWENVKIKNAWGMFHKCDNLTSAKLFNASSGTLVDISQLFHDDINLTSVTGLGNWNTKNVRDMSLVFANNQSLEAVAGVEKWNTSSVKTMYGMFYNTQNLKTIAGINNWNTSSVTNMIFLFNKSGVVSLDLSKWKIPTKMVPNGSKQSLPYSGMLWAYSLRDITLPKEHLTKADLPNHVWRKVSGRSDGNPVLPSQLAKSDAHTSGSEQQNNKYQRMMSDVVKVTFKNKANNVVISCVVDAWQGTDAHKLSDTAFYNCEHNIQNSNQKDSKSASAKDLENLATKAESLGLVNLAQIILKSKHSSIAALNNLIREGDNTRYGSTMTFDDIEKALGIKDNSLVDKSSIKWNATYDPILDKVAGIKRTNKPTFYYVNTGSSDEKANIDVKQKKTDSVAKINDEELIAIYDATFTVDAKYNKGKRPQPKPQPQPTPTPTPEPGPTPEPTPEPSPTPEPAPEPSPTPEPSPDDSDILPDITPKPDLNINSNNNFVHPFNKAPQSVNGDDVQNNKLQHSEINGRARLGVKEYVGSNSGTCKCVCPTLPKDAKSHKSNKSVRKSSNKATPCKSGNNYSWLGIGGLIISWLIMLLIGFIVGYKMRKKRDDEHSDENQDVIKD